MKQSTTSSTHRSPLKLSDKQKQVIGKMRKGGQLWLRFSHYIGKRATPELDGRKLNQSTFKSLKDKNLIYYSSMTTTGMTKHYYDLTDLGKNCIIE